MTTAELIHLLGIWAAGVFGLFVVFGRKGTWLHRWNGRGYVAAMLILSLAALGMLDGRHAFGSIQALALVILGAMSFGALAIRGGPQSISRVSAHGYAMSVTVVCLAGLGAVQVARAIDRSEPIVAGIAVAIGAMILANAPIRRAARRITEEL